MDTGDSLAAFGHLYGTLDGSATRQEVGRATQPTIRTIEINGGWLDFVPRIGFGGRFVMVDDFVVSAWCNLYFLNYFICTSTSQLIFVSSR